MSVMYGLACITMLGLLSGSSGHRSALPNTEKLLRRPVRRDVKAIPLNQPNTTALNTALAFEPYQDLTTRSAVEQQNNVLFSPLGLASALATLCRISGPESRRQALQALGVAADASPESVEATISALADLQHNLTLREGGAEGGIQKGQSEAAVAIGGDTVGAASDVNDGAGGSRGAESHSHARSRLRIWSQLHADGTPSVDFEGFLSQLQHPGQPGMNISFETQMKDLQDSDKLILNSFVYFQGLQPFERRHTVLRSFQLNATTSVEVDTMFLDDSSEVMMLYDTNCSATVVRLAFTGRLASLFLLPKGEIQPLEACLSDSRMRFWISNLKPGRAEIRLPKFRLRKSYSLESILRNSGISSLFLPGANFSGGQGRRKLQLHEAPHEVMLEVEESGSGETGRTDVPLDFSVPQRITFDRPFIFIVYDHLTGMVLLIGRIADPSNA
uniref:Corticosteroid-binding globulin n=1 Tax=Fundulus heteroclitus TaxID=8078 RepID=A0A146ZPG8_FUNHE